MYKVSVPLVRYHEDPAESIRQAKRLGASRVFLCPGRGLDKQERLSGLSLIRESLPIYREAGLEVGAWISTIGHGGPLVGEHGAPDTFGFTRITGLHGRTIDGSYCPLDENFSGRVAEYVAGLAGTGVSMIMLDDDFRMASRGDCGCVCELHMAELERRTGKRLRREDLIRLIFSGGRNKYRDAFLDMTGDTLRGFAAKLRAAVDSVNPSVRLGACSCMSVWDGDGVDSIELAKILAGGTEPFMRFIGAPYWSAGTTSRPTASLAYVAELERAQAHWCEGSGVELFSEGDVYPRPRYFVPAAYLEGFDTLLRAAGGLDGILKYGVDYSSSPLYETGYALRAERNRGLCGEIERRFSGKTALGVRVFSEMKLIRDKVFPENNDKIGDTYDDGFHTPEQLFLIDSSIPMTYSDSAVGIAFGENARAKGLSDCGTLMLDAPAAALLKSSGVDIGAEEIRPAASGIYSESYVGDETVVEDKNDGIFELTLKPGAEALSYFEGEKKIPSTYRYTNADGRRFLVFCFDGRAIYRNPRLSRGYTRQRQLHRELCPPVSCVGNPDLYVMAKRGEGSLAAGLWNFSVDYVPDAEVKLSKAYSRAEFINCSGSLEGDTVRIHGDIPAFGFAGFEVYE